MTQEQKDLLLKDLCGRLPYGVKVKLGDNPNVFDLEYRIKFAIMYGDSDKLEDVLDITNIKPYLFPLSSMTEEQMKESPFESSILHAFINGYISLFEDEELTISDIGRMLDWLNKNMFDWRGLIPMGLAIDCTNLNIY